LKSPRIAEKAINFFALGQEKIKKQFAAIVLRQALSIEPEGFPRYGYGFSVVQGNIHGHVATEFKLYYAVYSVL
jgi:hypothetical protein